MEEIIKIDREPMLGFIGVEKSAPISGISWKMVEIIYCRDNKEITVGEKRDKLYKHATGLYSWQIDDDDDIVYGSIVKILDALQSNPDCITFKELCTINGTQQLANHSIQYDDWADNQDGFDFVRTPYMKDVIRTEIAKSVSVPPLRFGEDHEWSKLLKPLLKSEIHIDEIIYLYQHESRPENFKERYGFKQATMHS